MLAGTAILAVLVFSRKKTGKLVGVLLIGALGQSLLLSPQVFALENKELVSYNRQVPISSGVSEADLAIEGYDYIGYFTASDLHSLKGVAPASLTEETSLKHQLAVSGNSKTGLDARGQEKQTELIEEEKPDQDISSQAGSISGSTPNPSSQVLPPNKETSKEENAYKEKAFDSLFVISIAEQFRRRTNGTSVLIQSPVYDLLLFIY